MGDTDFSFSVGNSQLNEKCAVFGVYGQSGEAARVAYYGLWALQHRGQESSGIVSSDGDKLYRHAAYGLVANVYRDRDIQNLKGNIAIGHNRYATSGGADEYFNQPFLHTKQQFALAHNGNLPDCTKLIGFLKSRKVPTKKLNDTRMMEKAIACFMQDGLSLESAIAAAYPLFTGVFSAVAMSQDTLVAFRDECGIRPLAIGQTEDSGYVVASETCALDTVGATYVRDIKPGEMVAIDKNGIRSTQIVESRQKLDIFEFVYFARHDSVLLGQCVNTVRERFGHEMAREFPIKADVVVPVPDSSIPAAIGYAAETGLPFEMGLIKNRYINRTFIQPTAEMRKRAVKMKLNPIRESIGGKRIVLVDDSIVRGTTMRQVVQMLRDAGAKEVHVCISSPPVRYPDFYGINTPDQNDLIAATMSVEEIREFLGADSLNFLSIEGMVSATQIPMNQFSMSCFDGVYPINIGARADDFSAVTHTKEVEIAAKSTDFYVSSPQYQDAQPIKPITV